MAETAAQVRLHAVGKHQLAPSAQTCSTTSAANRATAGLYDTERGPFRAVEYDEGTLTVLTENDNSVSCKPLHANSRQSVWVRLAAATL